MPTPSPLPSPSSDPLDESQPSTDSLGPIAKITYRCDGKNLFTAHDGSFRHAIPTGFVLYGKLYAVTGPAELNEAGDGITVECVHQARPR